MKRIYNTDKLIKSIKELRFEKAKIQIESIYLEEEIRKQMGKALHGGNIIKNIASNNFFANGFKLFIYSKSVLKIYNWIKNKFHKTNINKKGKA